MIAHILSSHPAFHRLVPGIQHAPPTPGVPVLVLDFPTGFALRELEADSVPCSRTTVVTASGSLEYRDCLASYQVRAVQMIGDDHAVQRSLSSNGRAAYVSRLTMTERLVLRLLLQGYSNTQVAARLRVTNKTISAHVSNMLRKLGYESRAQLVAGILSSCENSAAEEVAA